MWKMGNKIMNGVKGRWRQAGKPASLKQWAKHMAGEKGHVGAFCDRWLKNKKR